RAELRLRVVVATPKDQRETAVHRPGRNTGQGPARRPRPPPTRPDDTRVTNHSVSNPHADPHADRRPPLPPSLHAPRPRTTPTPPESRTTASATGPPTAVQTADHCDPPHSLSRGHVPRSCRCLRRPSYDRTRHR